MFVNRVAVIAGGEGKPLVAESSPLPALFQPSSGFACVKFATCNSAVAPHPRPARGHLLALGVHVPLRGLHIVNLKNGKLTFLMHEWLAESADTRAREWLC